MPLVVLHQRILTLCRGMERYDQEPLDPNWVTKLQELLEKTEIDLAAFARISETAPLCCSFRYEDGKLVLGVCNLTKRATPFGLFAIVKAVIEEKRLSQDLSRVA